MDIKSRILKDLITDISNLEDRIFSFECELNTLSSDSNQDEINLLTESIRSLKAQLSKKKNELMDASGSASGCFKRIEHPLRKEWKNE